MSFHFNPGQARAVSELLTTTCRFCLMYGGSRSGKTALAVSCIIDRALIADESRHLIVRRTAGAAVRAIVKDTFPKVWKLKFPDVPVPKYNSQLGCYVLPNKSEIWIGGLNDDNAVERILGNEYATIYVNEASEVPYTSFTLLRSRLAQVCVKKNGKELAQKFYLDLNPTTTHHWTYKVFVAGVDPETGEKLAAAERYGFVQINPSDNTKNLTDDYMIDLKSLSSRAKKRFYDGNYGADDESALWQRDWVKIASLGPNGDWPVEMKRIVVAIDPAATSKPGSDETGIVAVGLGVDNRGYVLADESGRYKPEEWAKAAVALYRVLDADCIVAEINNGGEMVESMIRAQDNLLPYKGVHASRGKVTRAEPVAALYQLKKISHCEEFVELVDQMCAVTIDFSRSDQGWSPDRVDALVWAVTDLFPKLTATRKHGNGAPMTAPSFSMV
tara:strand:+ start:467 stop:1798 length:1332 start_codon:yes stop_codon:yes gene_type:complete